MDYSQYINAATTQGPNMNEATKGGSGAYVPPVPGLALLRFVGYIELGLQESTWGGQTKTMPKVQLVFELHGKNYPVREFNGERIPMRITVTETLSLNDKANFRRIYEGMRNGRDGIRHMSQMLGQGFMGRVFNEPSKTDPTKVYARLRDASGYHIGLAVQEDAATGEIRAINVPPAITPVRLFLWDFADKTMWDSIFIDGDYGPGERTKNVFQELILKAKNFPGSPIQRALQGEGTISEIPENLKHAAPTAPQNTATAYIGRLGRRASAITSAPAPAPAPAVVPLAPEEQMTEEEYYDSVDNV